MAQILRAEDSFTLQIRRRSATTGRGGRFPSLVPDMNDKRLVEKIGTEYLHGSNFVQHVSRDAIMEGWACSLVSARHWCREIDRKDNTDCTARILLQHISQSAITERGALTKRHIHLEINGFNALAFNVF